MRRVVIVTLAAVMLASCGGGGSSKSAVASDSAPTTKATTTSTSTTTDAKAGCLAAMRKVPSPPKAPDLAPTLEVCRTIGEWVNAGKKAHIYFGYGPLPALIDVCHQAGSDSRLCIDAREQIPPSSTTTTTTTVPALLGLRRRAAGSAQLRFSSDRNCAVQSTATGAGWGRSPARTATRSDARNPPIGRCPRADGQG